MSIYLGIDLGKMLGRAALNTELRKGWWFDTIELSGKYGQRYHQLWETLEDWAGDTEPEDITRVVIEEPPYVNNRQVYGELCGYEAIAIRWCESNRIPWISLPNTTIKKLTCGSGAASKDDMLREACQILDMDVPTFKNDTERKREQNAYDAVLAAQCGRLMDE